MRITLPHKWEGTQSSLGTYSLLRRVSDSYFGTRHVARSAGSSGVSCLTVVETADAALRQRLAASALWCAELQHPLLPGDCRVEVESEALLRATAFHEGATARELLDALAERAESLPSEIAVRIALDVLEAMSALQDAAAAAHQGDLSRAHGGCHPETIHVGVDGQTRLLDVGLAAACAHEPRWSESTARLAYAAPEHCQARIDLDARSDIFSLGIVLWEMVACRPLFAGADPHSVRQQLLEAPIPRVFRDRFVRGEPISAALADITARALERAPERRFQAFAEVAEALRKSADVAPREEAGAFVERVLGARLVREHDISAVLPLVSEDELLFDSPTRPHRALPPRGESAALDERLDSGVRDAPTHRPPPLAVEASPPPASAIELFVDPEEDSEVVYAADAESPAAWSEQQAAAVLPIGAPDASRKSRMRLLLALGAGALVVVAVLMALLGGGEDAARGVEARGGAETARVAQSETEAAAESEAVTEAAAETEEAAAEPEAVTETEAVTEAAAEPPAAPESGAAAKRVRALPRGRREPARSVRRRAAPSDDGVFIPDDI